MQKSIIMLSDDTHMRTQLNKLLSEMLFKPCEFFKSHEEFFKMEGAYSAKDTIVIIDDRFQYKQALQICYKIQQKWPGIRIVKLLKTDEELADYPIENGSMVYLPKPLSVEGLRKAFNVEKSFSSAPNIRNCKSLLIGNSDCMQKLRNRILKIAACPCNTIITGETGSGKEVTIQELKNLTGKELVAVNCASLNGDLADSDLFGHLKGSFTGSINDRIGYIKRADGGFLFLDEIETLSPQAQASLLRFLDSGEYYTVGGEKLHRAKVIVLAATNEPVDKLMANGMLRRDFIMRLNICNLRIPPLREHLEDIPLLVRHREDQLGWSTHISEMAAAYSYDWKGNVRELFNVVQRAHQENPENPVITRDIILG